MRTAEYEAGQFFEAWPDMTAVNDAKKNGQISTQYRPLAFIHSPSCWWESPIPQEEANTLTAKIVKTITSMTRDSLISEVFELFSTWRHQKENAQYGLTAFKTADSISNNPELKTTLQALIHQQIQIDELNSSRINACFYSIIGLLLASRAAVLSSLGGISWLMTAGQVTLVASVIFAATHFQSHMYDEGALQQHYLTILSHESSLIESLVNRAFTALANAEDDLTPRNNIIKGTGSALKPLYPEYYPDPLGNVVIKIPPPV